ncbi:Putative membrane protein [Zobellia galactanivorans]|uniref:Putative membrane protein n=1 Tax=Zobellia galactanivorans (strain DSM 12802 / CCUG 47099 / CIP 106680 / NCIMB 13871 / Dsij) TaxID=63186 RepID=G0L616_ZOBGA|nr:Putative membrane protein [Zobellia galactanivorans]
MMKLAFLVVLSGVGIGVFLKVGRKCYFDYRVYVGFRPWVLAFWV